jgi:hypothetical protein
MAQQDIDPGLISTPTLITSPSLEKTGEEIATSKFGQEHPILGAAAGTLVAKGPELATTASMLGKVPELAAGVKAIPEFLSAVKSKLPKILTAPSKAVAGEELGAAQESAGLIKPLEEVSDPRSRKAIVEMLPPVKKLAGMTPEKINEVMEPQGILDFRTKLQEILDHLKVAKQGVSPKQLISKSSIATISKAVDKLGKAITQAEPGVGEAMANFAAAAQRADLIKKALKIGGAATGAGVAYEVGKKLLKTIAR